MVSPAIVLSGRANFEGIFGTRSVDLAGFLSTRALPWWSPTSSSPVVSSHVRGGPSCSAHGQHAPESFLPLG